MTTAAQLRDGALLVELRIRQWDATRTDEAVSKAVDTTYAAHKAGKYIKHLVDPALLEPVQQAARALRTYHHSHTLPWSDSGQRLLPSRLFMEYRDGMQARQDTFNRCAQAFCQHYSTAVAQAQQRLGQLYNPKDYPDANDIAQAFQTEVSYIPIPEESDFRLAIAQEEADSLRANLSAEITQRHNQALQACYQQAKLLLERIKTQCNSAKPVIRDTLLGNTAEFARLLESFNITGDPTLTQLQRDIQAHILNATNSHQLRASAAARQQTAAAADALLARLPI